MRTIVLLAAVVALAGVGSGCTALITPHQAYTPLFDHAGQLDINLRAGPTTPGGVFSGDAVAQNPNRISVNGAPYGATSYVINGQIASGALNNGHYTRGTRNLIGITDGTSNTVLFAERMAWCMGPDYPKQGVTPNLGTGSFTYSIWARGPRQTAHSPWVDGAPGISTIPPTAPGRTGRIRRSNTSGSPSSGRRRPPTASTSRRR